MKKICLSLIIACLSLSGCYNGGKKIIKNDIEIGTKSQELEGQFFNGFSFPTNEEKQAMKNNLLFNKQIIENDKLLRVGDLGVGKHLNNIQDPPRYWDNQILKKLNNNNNNNANITNVHHNWKYPSIHQTFINPKTKAINGNYINNVVGKAWDYYGTPYEYGSNRNTDTTFDCSDFVRWVHLWTLGMDLPKDSRSQYEYVKKFSKRHYTDLSQAKRGDILFFMSYRGWKPQDYKGINVKQQTVAHCGIYAGNGILIHTASKATGGVRHDIIKGSHLEYRFIGGGQVVQ